MKLCQRVFLASGVGGLLCSFHGPPKGQAECAGVQMTLNRNENMGCGVKQSPLILVTREVPLLKRAPPPETIILLLEKGRRAVHLDRATAHQMSPEGES